MNNYVNPPCKVISHALHQIRMASFEDRVAAFFTAGVSSSVEGELVIDGTTSTLSLAPNVCVVPGASAVVEEDEKCVGDFSSPDAGEESAARHLEG